MKLSLAELWDIRGALELHLNGINIRTNVRTVPKNVLPASMKRHLRRVLEEIDSEIKIAEPNRTEFIAKWKVYGENKDSMPTPEDECFAEYQKEIAELFDPRDFVIPFSPFHMGLLDNIHIVLDDGIDNLMTWMNEVFFEQQIKVASEEDSSAGENIAPVSAKPDAK